MGLFDNSKKTGNIFSEICFIWKIDDDIKIKLWAWAKVLTETTSQVLIHNARSFLGHLDLLGHVLRHDVMYQSKSLMSSEISELGGSHPGVNRKLKILTQCITNIKI